MEGYQLWVITSLGFNAKAIWLESDDWADPIDIRVICDGGKKKNPYVPLMACSNRRITMQTPRVPEQGHAICRGEIHAIWKIAPGMPLALIETEHLTNDHVAKVTHHELEGVQPAKASSWQVNSNLCIMYVVHHGLGMSKARRQR